ncbi:hypothetical protein FB451DRAFT_1182890 [Mycena latifolia]|nr:hypothetical protein FB451DRAFT_1182890 [Mycena latifolia]
MPPLPIVKASNLTFAASYIPVAVFSDGTSGVGEAMAEAFAHRVRIVSCDPRGLSYTAGFRWVGARVRAMRRDEHGERAGRIRGPPLVSGTLEFSGDERWGQLDARPQVLLTLHVREGAASASHLHIGERPACASHVCVGPWFWSHDPDKRPRPRKRPPQHHRTVERCYAALKGMIRGVAYNDGLLKIRTSPSHTFTQARLLPPLNVAVHGMAPRAARVDNQPRHAIQADFGGSDYSASYMLYALFDGERGVLIRDNYADLVSGHVCEPGNAAQFAAQGSLAHKKVHMSRSSDFPARRLLWITSTAIIELALRPRHFKYFILALSPRPPTRVCYTGSGYSGSDATMKQLIDVTERVQGAI